MIKHGLPFLLALFWVSGGVAPLVSGQEDNQPPPGFTTLFNGQDLSQWRGLRGIDPHIFRAKSPEEQQEILDQDQADMLQHWRVEAGEIINDGQGVYLTTRQDYRDFELWLDYKTVPLADSGIYLKGAPQVQIWDTTEAGGKWDIGAQKGSGGLWNNHSGSPGKDPLVHADKPFGQWNRMRMIQIGERTSVWLNGSLVVDHARLENKHWNGNRPADQWLPLVAAGPIQLQTHGGEIRWRNLFIREFSSEEATSYLAEKNSTGFQAAFNGKDFQGWSGPTENYEIRDGVLRCRPDQGGTIYTDEVYRDFVVRLQFKLPEGGNNGLAIRYPGHGDAAYSGMCELQVLHNDAEQYSQLDPRQYHGSAYGMVAAHRGYLRSPGEWNFQEVTVKGSTIVVELNGTVILNTDLNEVIQWMDDRPHPSQANEAGHFGFCGHHDPVEFREIWIKTLPENENDAH